MSFGSAPSVSAVVVTYGRRDLLAKCLESVEPALAAIGEPAELVVVDNGSCDGTSDYVRERYPSALVIELTENIGFTRAVMKGIRAARGEWIALLNDDVTVERDTLALLLEAGRGGPDIGSVASQMRFAGNRALVNSAGVEVDALGIGYDRLLGRPADEAETRPVEVFGVSGGASLYRRAMLDDVGGFDETFFAYLDDIDVAWRARMRGWRALYVPQAVSYHHHAATLVHGSPHKFFWVGRNRVRMLAKNADARHLRRHALGMLAYDLGYVAFVAATARTLAPLRGRLVGLREWRRYRRQGATLRRPIELAPAGGFREALRRHRSWTAGKPE